MVDSTNGESRATSLMIIDDDLTVLGLLYDIFVQDGWDTYCAASGTAALNIARNRMLDIIILDLMLPDMDGYETFRLLRDKCPSPIIILSALSQHESKIKCLDLGADDYVTKPFNVAELLARTRAVLRRCTFDYPASSAQPFECEGFRIDYSKRLVTCSGEEIPLTPTEYNLLRELTLHAGKTLTYSHLLGRVWGPEYETEKEYLHVYIRYLRAKIEPNPRHPEYIFNVSRVGYRFRERS